jgi:hypothetical protein
MASGPGWMRSKERVLAELSKGSFGAWSKPLRCINVVMGREMGVNASKVGLRPRTYENCHRPALARARPRRQISAKTGLLNLR